MNLSATLGQPGTYDIGTNLIDLGTVEVTDDSVTTSDEEGTATPEQEADGEEMTPGPGTPTPTEAPGVFGPGFGPVAALLALCVLALLGLEHRD